MHQHNNSFGFIKNFFGMLGSGSLPPRQALSTARDPFAPWLKQDNKKKHTRPKRPNG